MSLSQHVRLARVLALAVPALLLGGAYLIWRGLQEPVPEPVAAAEPAIESPAPPPPAGQHPKDDPFRIRPAPGADGPA